MTPSFSITFTSSSNYVLSSSSSSSEGQRFICCGNIGDTNAVLCRKKGIPLLLTVEHNASKNQAEVDRIREAGVFVSNGKVAGMLSVTRAFGDVDMKPYVSDEREETFSFR
jgi:serine/threonine protein phosphatase PrpC